MEGTSGPGVGAVVMLVQDAGVGMMIFGGIVTVGETFAAGAVQEEMMKSKKQNVNSFFM